MLYLAMVDITKNGLDTDRIGDRSIRSWKYFLKNDYPDYKLFLAFQGWLAQPALLDMSGNCIIIQARAEPQKSALPRITNDISYISF